MKREIKFLADMGVSPRCAEWLRLQGYDAVHLFEQGLHKLSDSDVLRKAKHEERVVLTMDLDFANIISKASSNSLVTVVIFRLSDQRPHNIQDKLGAILPIIKNCAENGAFILSVTDYKVRARKLPIN